MPVQFEALCHLIEASTPQQLRSLTQLIFRALGFAEASITDGPHDGGADLRLLTIPAHPLPVAVQTSIEKDWRKKLRGDASRIKTKLELRQMYFISSRRMPQASLQSVQAELLQLGVSVTAIDQQAIASMLISHHKMPEALAILDLPELGGAAAGEPSDRRRDAAFAYSFFAPEVRAFRDAIREQALMLALFHAGGEARVEELCESAAQLLGMRVDEALHLRSDVDRMRQSPRLLGRNGSVRLPETELKALAALRSLRRREEDDLVAELEALLDQHSLKPASAAAQAAMQRIGALLILHDRKLESLDPIRAQLRTLRAELRAFGLPDGQRGEATLMAIVECARSSPLGRHLAAGTLYQALTSLPRDAFLRALDARSASLVLDASVALPMFCALFQGSVQQRYFIAAEELHRRARQLGFALQLPQVWLEEMAAHLLLALDYAELAAADPEGLRLSRNAYVAYYACKRRQETTDDFASYLASFGLTPQIALRAATDRPGARNHLEAYLRRQLAHYAIEIVDTPALAPHLKQVERDWGWGLHALGRDRGDELLERHDKQVLAWLAGIDPLHAPLLVTWDRLLKTVRPDDAPGGALDPLALCDLLALIHGEALPAEALRFAALGLTEVEAERSAAVLDALVQIEKSRLSDARLVQAALTFKTRYLREHHEMPAVVELTQAWNELRPQTP